MINRRELYRAVASHTQAYATKQGGGAYTVAERVDEILAIKSEVDDYLLILEPEEDAAQLLATEMVKHDAVSNYLVNLKVTDTELFEIERKLPHKELMIKAGV